MNIEKTPGGMIKHPSAYHSSNTPPSGAAGGDLAGTYPNPTVAKISKSLQFTGIIYDTFTTKKDNYNPTGLADASTIQLTITGDQILTGIAGGSAGRILIIQSGYTGSTDKLTLKNNSNDSIAANRFYCPLSTDFVLSDDNSVILQYDAIQERWIVIATCQAPYGTASNTICEGNDSRLSNARTPTSHASTHNAGGGDALAIDAAAGTGSLRTIGTGALTACAGNDSRLSNARTPTSHASTHNAGGGDALAIDAAAGTGSLRTIGTGALTACAGNDSRLSDARTPTSHLLGSSSHTADTIANVNAKLSDGDMITTLAGEINALSPETTPLATDILIMEDSQASAFTKKKITLANLSKAIFPEFQFFADQLRTPVSSEWPRYGTAAATLAQDSANGALLNRQFDDTVDEGTALDVFIPVGATSIIFDFYSRAQTAPAAAKIVLPGIYTRQVADNAAPGSFSSLVALTAIDIPTNTYYQYDTQTIALSTLSLTAGRLTEILLERTATSATDDLVGDWNLNLLRVRFS